MGAYSGGGVIRDGGLLIYVTFLCANFLKAAPENKLRCDRSWEEKAGSWTYCPGKVRCSYKEQDIRKYFIQQVAGRKKIIQILNWMLLLRL